MNIVTITSQGQITLPASVRRALNLKASDTLELTFNSETRRISMEKQMTLDEFEVYSKETTKKIDPKIKPVENVDEYYQAYRQAGETSNE